jgi:transcriptional repressor NrdR
MRCPQCEAPDTRVIDSRPADGGHSIRRRRLCERCDARFTTYERMVTARMVRKRSGRLEPFDPAKLRRGLEAALADRPVAAGAIDELIAGIDAHVTDATVPVDSEQIGRMVLEALRALDEVAYLRFASVYQDFQGLSDFEQALADLEDPVTAAE